MKQTSIPADAPARMRFSKLTDEELLEKRAALDVEYLGMGRIEPYPGSPSWVRANAIVGEMGVVDEELDHRGLTS